MGPVGDGWARRFTLRLDLSEAAVMNYIEARGHVVNQLFFLCWIPIGSLRGSALSRFG